MRRCQKPIRLGFFCLAILSASGYSYAKEWRSIIPLHSTRADVERLLGPPDDPNTGDYHTKTERILIDYSRGLFCDQNNIWKVPKDTVVGIIVYPRKAPRLSSLKLNLNEFSQDQSGDVIGVNNYKNMKDGLRLTVIDGKVESFHYFPSAKDDAFRCPDLMPRPSREYVSTLSTEEKELLDRFMARLKDDPNQTGLIMAAGEGRRVDQPGLVEDVTKYLKTRYDKDFNRLIVIENFHMNGRLDLSIRKDGKLIRFP